MPYDEAVFDIGHNRLSFRRPQKEKRRQSLQKEGMRSVIYLLLAEIPQRKPNRIREILCDQDCLTQLDPVSARHTWVVVICPPRRCPKREPLPRG